MLKEIIEEVEQAINDCFLEMINTDYNSFILLIGRADVFHSSSNEKPIYVIDSQLDRYNDETREKFYIRYLNRNYRSEGFRYNGGSGIDDLSIEMMIFSHLWDSEYFLKSLYRITSILIGCGYVWDFEIPTKDLHTFISNKIIEPLKSKGISLGNLLGKAYKSAIRNAFAHSNYNINAEKRQIYIHPKTGSHTYSFDEFQEIFLYSVILMYKLQNTIETNHDAACKLNACLTNGIVAPDGTKLRVLGILKQRGSRICPEFRLEEVR